MKKIKEFTAAIILSAILFPIGFVFNILAIVLFKKKFFVAFWRITKEVLLLINDIFERIAIIIDRLGNVIDGNMFILLFVKNKYHDKTLFGKNEITVSAASGHAENYDYLNNFGNRFVKALNKTLGKNHCKNAYEWYLVKQKHKKANSTAIS